MLTEHWYGRRRVARVVGIDRYGDAYVVSGDFVDGSAPRDKRAAKAWLRDLRRRFEEARSPNWQLDPRQPRVDNVL